MGSNPVVYIYIYMICELYYPTERNVLYLLQEFTIVKMCNISEQHVGLKIVTFLQNLYLYEGYLRSRICMCKLRIIEVFLYA